MNYIFRQHTKTHKTNIKIKTLINLKILNQLQFFTIQKQWKKLNRKIKNIFPYQIISLHDNKVWHLKGNFRKNLHEGERERVMGGYERLEHWVVLIRMMINKRCAIIWSEMCVCTNTLMKPNRCGTLISNAILKKYTFNKTIKWWILTLKIYFILDH